MEDDLYSGQAEAFGLLTSLIFLRHYLASYGQEQFTTSKLDCFCNNIDVITNVDILLAPAKPKPNDTTSDDRDIYIAISTLVLQCSPLQPRFLHVKGHQDAQANRPLTIIEQHNVDCDSRTKSYTQTTTKTSTSYGNPAIPTAQPHLIIANKLICRNLTTMLQHTMAFLEYQQYLQKKLNCTEHTIQDVKWKVFLALLNSFGLEDQRRLILFTNGKLPLRASPAHPHHGSHLCPSCQCKTEDKHHFVKCTHPKRTTLFCTLHQQLIKLAQNLKLHPSILTALWLDLVATRTEMPYPDVQDDMPLNL